MSREGKEGPDVVRAGNLVDDCVDDGANLAKEAKGGGGGGANCAEGVEDDADVDSGVEGLDERAGESGHPSRKPSTKLPTRPVRTSVISMLWDCCGRGDKLVECCR